MRRKGPGLRAAAALMLAAALPAAGGAVFSPVDTGLLAGSAVYAQEAVTEENVSEETGAPSPLSELLSREELSLTPEAADELQKLIDEMGAEQLIQIASTAWNVANTEEFRELMEHPEMQALVRSALKKGVELVRDDPAMVKEILVTLGVKETYVQLIGQVLAAVDQEDPDLINRILGS